MRLPNDLTPVSYLMDEDTRTLYITWSDGHESRHPYEVASARLPVRVVRGRRRHEGQRRP